MTPRARYINPPDLARPSGFSHVTVAPAGEVVFVSGQVAYDADGRIVGEGDLAAQTRQVLQNLGTALQAAGSDFGHLVKLTFFVKGLDEAAVATIRTERKAFLRDDALPASTMVGVAALAKAALLLEVEAYAVRKAGA